MSLNPTDWVNRATFKASVDSRERRMRMFADFLVENGFSGAVVADVGGTAKYWNRWASLLPPGVVSRIDVINTPEQMGQLNGTQSLVSGILLRFVAADIVAEAGSGTIASKYDVVHSISTVEHVGPADRQAAFCAALRRLGGALWVQTPAKEFPLEAHFRLPFFAYLPLYVRAFFNWRFRLGVMPRHRKFADALEFCRETRLLGKKTFAALFPRCDIWTERVCGFPKCYIASRAAMPRRIGVLGAGLIGGSLLLALRKLLPEAVLVAGAPSEKTREAVRASGVADIVFDPSTQPPEQALAGCDIAFLAAPPRAVCEMLPRFAGADIGLVVDLCSVKGPVMDAAKDLGNFIGGHPMAGNEGVGFAAANVDLFRNAAFVYCKPSSYAAGEHRVFQLLRLIRALGMRSISMDASEHDSRLAVVSHLPHVAAFALSLLAARRGDPVLAKLVGGGFRDTTRIAASSPRLWTDILRSSPALEETLDSYCEILLQLRKALSGESDPAVLEAILSESERYRREIPDGLHRVPHA